MGVKWGVHCSNRDKTEKTTSLSKTLPQAIERLGRFLYINRRKAALESTQSRFEVNWRLIALITVGYIIILRLVFSGIVDLIPEEAYYWNYAQHADIGYLDHPPMVAWLIWLSTSIFGRNEFAVRLPALLSWVIAAFFIFRLTVNLYDRSSAYRSTLLMATLPIYFAIGCLMTPDAPVYAAWAAALYFFERALLARKRAAWLGVGLSLGLGMISKYTIALLVPSALLFILADRDSRRWLLRPEPYVAAVLGLAIFSPVLIWNAQHDWASFVFQGPRRWSGGIHFSTHLVLGGALVLLTPVGLVNAINAIWPGQRYSPEKTDDGTLESRRKLFLLLFTLVPLVVFIIHSLRSAPKLNWTGPVWLVLIPLIAWKMVPHGATREGWWFRFGRGLWKPTVITLPAIYTAAIAYLLLGTPGTKVDSEMALPVAWHEMGDRVEQIEHEIWEETGSEPIIVGMDRYWISSQLSFYDDPEDDSVSTQEFGGRFLVGEKSLMWDTWLPPSKARGRNIVLVDFDRGNLDKSELDNHFRNLGKIMTEPIVKHGRLIGYFHWRVGYDYKG